MLIIAGTTTLLASCILRKPTSSKITFHDKKDSLTNDTDKTFQKLIKGARIDSGLIRVIHKEKDYYFELPLKLMGKDLLLVNKISSVPLAINEAGVNKGINFDNKVICFTVNKELMTVWASQINPQTNVSGEDAIARSVKDNYTPSVIESFKIEAYNTDSSAVLIKVNKVFDGSEKSFNDVFNDIGLGTSPKPALSAIQQIKSFEKNVLVRALLSTSVTEGPSTIPISVTVTSNLLLLPEQPMKARFSDNRIGYFSTPRWYFSDKQQQLEKRELITRWRLEPRDEDKDRYLKGELVIPKKPIQFYIDPSTPRQWKPYIMAGITDWQKAFEAAGFKNAIVAYEIADTSTIDPDDTQYSVVTYAASPTANAMGPSVVDPRSGEILEADVIWWHNVMSALSSWMRVQIGIVDTAVRRNVIPDDRMGEAIRFASSHEIGHSLGLKHNMGASWAYPVDSLRSPTFTHLMGGTASSIMDYARFNYVAQPGDGVTELSPKIGIYDRYAIAWGYRWIDSRDPWTEMPITRSWIATHQNDPLYRYGEQQDADPIIDPRNQPEDLGNDAVQASTYGLLNLQRLIPQIIDWTTQPGDNYTEAGKLYMAAIGQWRTYAEQVLANIGGIYLENPVKGDHKKAYLPVSRLTQLRAFDYLAKNALSMPRWLFPQNLIEKTFPERDTPLGLFEYGPNNLQRELQYGLLYTLLNDERLLRMTEMELLYGKKACLTVGELFQNTRQLVMAPTIAGSSLTAEQRMLQQNYIDVLLVSTDKALEKIKKKELAELNQVLVTKSLPCSQPLLRNIHVSSMTRTSPVITEKRAELLAIRQLLTKKLHAGDIKTQAHYQDLLLRINEQLIPRNIEK
ncbi:protein of unknown function [bacterium A37T11]|nr:protein of unknown function [bacterium A37T11]